MDAKIRIEVTGSPFDTKFYGVTMCKQELRHTISKERVDANHLIGKFYFEFDFGGRHYKVEVNGLYFDEADENLFDVCFSDYEGNMFCVHVDAESNKKPLEFIPLFPEPEIEVACWNDKLDFEDTEPPVKVVRAEKVQWVIDETIDIWIKD